MKKQLFVLVLLIAYSLNGFSQWQLDSLAPERIGTQAVAWQNKVYIIGGKIFDPYPYGTVVSDISIYNCTTSQWDSALALPEPRISTTAIAGDSAIYILGGSTEPGMIRHGTNTIYTYKNGAIQTDTIADHIYLGSAVKAGSKLIFAGFADSINYYTSEIFASDIVYIYDELTGVWSTSHLSTPRTGVAAATDGTLAIFAGGFNGLDVASDVVDIYNTISGTWTTTHLSSARTYVKGAYCNGKFYFAGGCTGGAINYSSDVIDVFDGSNWSTLQLSVPRANMAIAAVADKVYFIGGGDEDLSMLATISTFDAVDVLNTTNGNWSRMDLPVTIENAAYTVSGNKIFIGPGRHKIEDGQHLWGNYCKYVQMLDVNVTAVSEFTANNFGLSVYPNPSNGMFTVFISGDDAEIFITDIFGKEILRTKSSEKNIRLQLDESGIYFVSVKIKDGVVTQKLIVVK